ncbi:MAG: DUF3052 domain-containing protein [Gemmatimonadota bacterium]|nr:DUF3052 domain-containing protein [Gemmatimonadota bacterium]
MTAGYSGTSLAKKLGIKEGHSVLVVAPPDQLADLLEPLPAGVGIEAVGISRPRVDGAGVEMDWQGDSLPDDRFDVVLLFSPGSEDLHENFGAAVSRLRWNGGLWVCWPKKSSEHFVDLAESEVRRTGLSAGLVDNKICAVDDDWSGLRFVVRIADRPREIEVGGPEL